MAAHIVYLADCRVVPGATLSAADFLDVTATAESLRVKVQKALDDEIARNESREKKHRRRAAELVLTPDSISTTLVGLKTLYRLDSAMLAFIDATPFGKGDSL